MNQRVRKQNWRHTPHQAQSLLSYDTGAITPQLWHKVSITGPHVDPVSECPAECTCMPHPTAPARNSCMTQEILTPPARNISTGTLPPTCLLQDAEHTVQVIHCTLHCCADVDVEDGGATLVGLQACSQLVIVDLTAVQGVDLRVQPAQKRDSQCIPQGLTNAAS
jgi:hypothetical protein